MKIAAEHAVDSEMPSCSFKSDIIDFFQDKEIRHIFITQNAPEKWCVNIAGRARIMKP